ncbi:osteopontin-like isoform X2 [Frieseomelitta varia]|uniref:osteopontin-like isoform X2 n=1 Tax=Frieseomelitta varia TaxID=561572 RepID=UPI001CB67A4C|nr:osteopontin-like isoform X2 [Frieseomelitta varia]
MSARSQRGAHDTPTAKRFRSPRITAKSRAAKPQITYDYNAAISQPDVPNSPDYKKVGRDAMKRSQEFKAKSPIQRNTKIRSPKRGNWKTIVSSDIENRIDEKETITANSGTDDIRHLSDLLRRNLVVNGKNISFKDTKEAIENDDDDDDDDDDSHGMTQEEIKNEKSDDCESATTKSPVQVKGSKIPRARIAIHTFHSTKRIKTKESPRLKYSTIDSPADNTEILENEIKKGSSVSKEEQSTYRQAVVPFDELQNDTKIVWNKEETSTLEADEEAEDRGLTSTDESTVVISSVDDPHVLTVLRSLKLNCPCKSCTEHNPVSSNRQEDNSDLKSSSPEEIGKKKWSLKYRKYIEATSEDVNVSSDHSDEYSKKERTNRYKAKYTLTQRIKTSSIVRAPPKITNRRRTSFSFFNTLFDIVFWPYLFLKTNR